ncbi:MAG: sigma-70 family RNA polymerase sigma factor, partial [bacterium]
CTALAAAANPDDPVITDVMVQWAAAFVRQALEALSPDQREVVELAFFHGLSYGEIARVVGCPVNTVKTRMYWAKRKLREALNASAVRRQARGGRP